MTLALQHAAVIHGETWRLAPTDLAVEPGTVHALIGPNGAGKTTALRLLAGDLAPSHGRVAEDGRPVRRADPALARRRAVLPQRAHLAFDFAVREVVALGRHPHPEPASVTAAAVDDALTAMDLHALAGRGYQHLSGGEAQRTQIARVLAQIWDPSPSAPRYLLLDEPAAGLDLRHQHGLMRHLREQATHGVGTLCVLHDLELAHRYADRVTLMAEGAVVATADSLANIPRDALRDAYGIDVHVAASSVATVQVGRQDPPCPPGPDPAG